MANRQAWMMVYLIVRDSTELCIASEKRAYSIMRYYEAVEFLLCVYVSLNIKKL